PDSEYGVFACFVLPELRANPCEQHREAKWLCDVVVCSGFESENRIGIDVMSRQHDDGAVEAVLAQDANRLASIDIRQPDVHDHQVHLSVLGRLNALRAAVG